MLRRKFYKQTLPAVGFILLLVMGFQYYLIVMLSNLKTKWVSQTKSPELYSQSLLEHDKHLQQPANSTLNDNTVIPPQQPDIYETFSKHCEVLTLKVPQSETPPFKVFVYDLPAKYNIDLVKCVHEKDGACFKTDSCGMGNHLYDEENLAIHNTWQFSLELVLHHKLLFSPYRTLNTSEAAVFYVPYYAGLACFCHQQWHDKAVKGIKANVDGIMDYLNDLPHYREGLPHIMALGKIEREHFSNTCPLLKHPNSRNLTILGIEMEANVNHRRYFSKHLEPLIVVPYPSYAHFHPTKTDSYLKAVEDSNRNIYLFLAASVRRSNPFRAKILDQFLAVYTEKSYKHYFHTNSLDLKSKVCKVWLSTPECRGGHHLTTVEWMKHATFCLQPPGDSPTRKSLYDAILSNCIPVVFNIKKYTVIYPFQPTINYSKLIVWIPEELVNKDIAQYLRAHVSTQQIADLQQYGRTIMKYLQYSYPIANHKHEDAVQMILDDISKYHKLTKK